MDLIPACVAVSVCLPQPDLPPLPPNLHCHHLLCCFGVHRKAPVFLLELQQLIALPAAKAMISADLLYSSLRQQKSIGQ